MLTFRTTMRRTSSRTTTSNGNNGKSSSSSSNNNNITQTQHKSNSLVAALLLGLLVTTFFSVFLHRDPYGHHHHSPVRHALEDFKQVSKSELIRDLYPNVDPIPNPPLSNGSTTFSGCLLVMDDNHRLVEWLAYHYHVLPLRYLIVAKDPRSSLSPTYILNQFRKLGVHVLEWNDQDFWFQKNNVHTLRELPLNATFQMKRDRHRGRQKYFYKQCLMKLKRENRTWVSLHDSDEYIVYNHPGMSANQFVKWKEQAIQRKKKKNRQHQLLIPSQPPPTTAQEGGMIQYIEQERAAGLAYYQSPCIGIPRLMFGSSEDSEKQSSHDIPSPLHHLVASMDTLRYRQHAPRNDFVKNALGKVILDVSRVDIQHTPYFMSLHRPIKTICSAPWHNDWESGLRINHYLGSWESYSFRVNDSRRGGERSWEAWEYKSSTLDDTTDDTIRPWVHGFVQTHGIKQALDIFQHVGLPRSYRSDPNEWKLTPEKLAELWTVNESNTNDAKKLDFAKWVRRKYNHSDS